MDHCRVTCDPAVPANTVQPQTSHAVSVTQEEAEHHEQKRVRVKSSHDSFHRMQISGDRGCHQVSCLQGYGFLSFLLASPCVMLGKITLGASPTSQLDWQFSAESKVHAGSGRLRLG
jgi:hypothetical protein